MGYNRLIVDIIDNIWDTYHYPISISNKRVWDTNIHSIDDLRFNHHLTYIHIYTYIIIYIIY